ncbi:MAG: hypothetical protein NWQ69_01215, partial [Paracoccaceae bacterium]|nr:hypothetical protein [Paracoccaceae bacterium]
WPEKAFQAFISGRPRLSSSEKTTLRRSFFGFRHGLTGSFFCPKTVARAYAFPAQQTDCKA